MMSSVTTQGYRISPAQSRLWLQQQRSAVYRAQCAIRVDGPVQIASLKTAIESLVNRLEILRTTFRLQPGIRVPWQVITDSEKPSWRQLDWSGQNRSQVEAALDGLLREERQRSVNLETGPALQLTLATVAAHEHYLILSLPALCADARSLTNLFNEVVGAYSAVETTVAADEEPLQYADFADWHWQLLEEDEQSPGRTYWHEQRLSVSSLSTLRGARASGPQRTFDVAVATSPVDERTARAARSLADDRNAPVSDFYLACWEALVSRLSGQADVVMGAVADERGHDALLNACGLMSTTLPVRSRFEEHTRFDDVFHAVARSRRTVSDRQFDFSWERNVEGGKPDGEPGFFPLTFEFNALPSVRDVGAVSFSIVRSFACTDRFHVKVNCVQRGDAICIEWHFDPSVLSNGRIEHLARHYQALVKSAVDNPGAFVLDLDLIDETLRREIVVGFNDVERGESTDRCVHECFEDVVSQYPDRTALVYEDERLSYRELNARCNQLARHLRSRGVGADVPVALCVERSLDMIVGMLGVLKAGGAYVPLDPSLPAERLALLLEESKAPVVVCQPHLAELLPPSGPSRVVLDTETRRAISRESAENCFVGVTPANLTYIIFTSGSTGTPKGVLVEHRQLTNYVDGVLRRLQLSRDASFATVSSYAADLGNTAIFPALTGGGCLHVVSQNRVLDPDAMADYVERHGVDCLKIVPSHLQALLSSPRPARVLPRRCLVLGGEASTWDLVSRLESLSSDYRIVNHYGPTETTVGVLAYRHERGHIRRDESDTLPLGRPLSNSRVYLLDSRARPVPVGINGELHIAGAGLARGYLDRPDQTAERFVPDPVGPDPGARMYKTGDLARYLTDGSVEFVGRVDHQVKIRGFRVELGEIEAALERHASIDDAVVTVSEVTPGDKRLVGYAVRRRDAHVTTDELREWLRVQLPDYMVPGTIVWLDALPLNRNGKVDRGALPAVELVTESARQAHVAPRTANEATLLAIWSAVLGKQDLGITDDFFECGGHSLLAMQLITRVREAFEVDLPLPALFDRPTIAGLAEVIESLIGAGQVGVATAMEPVSRDRTLPLSFAQQRLWFLDQLEPDSSAYNRPFAIRLAGSLKLASLVQSLEEMVRRHEVLRTTYPTVDGKAQQVITAAALPMRVVDLRHLREEQREQVARVLSAEDARKTFDLARGPLVRACAMQLGDADHVLLLSQHHINTDAWSNDVVVHEVSTAYRAFSNGAPSPLADLSIQYADFASWQREWLESETARQQLAFWQKEFETIPPTLQLPVDRPRPLAQTFHGDARHFTLSPHVTAALRELSHTEGATLFMTLLAAFQTLLHRYTGQPDILVGTPIAGRTRPEVEGLIGFFVNTLVLRADLRGRPAFRDVVTQIRQRAVSAYANQDLPFETLVDALELERDLSRTPLFQVMFLLQNDALRSLRLPDLTARQVEMPIETAKFDLTLYMAETEQGLKGSLEYNTDLFDASTIDRMCGHFETLLEAAVADPKRPVAELPLLREAERQQLLVEWNDTRVDYPAGECLHELIEAQVESSPDAVALVFEEQQLSYRELNTRANQLAWRLRQSGVGPDVLVGVCMERSLEMVVGLLAVLKAGGAYVPLDPEYPAARLRTVLDDARPAAVLTQQHLRDHLPETSLPVYCLDGDRDVTAVGEHAGRPSSGVGAGNAAYVIYTSGSTGLPKGVLNTHEGICNRLRWMQDTYGLSGADRVLQKTPATFDVSVWEFFWPIMTGASLVLARPGGHRDPPYLMKTIDDQRITTLHFVPSMLQVFLSDAQLPPSSSTSLRRVVCSGEALPYDLKERFLSGLDGVELHNLYGPTEAAIDVTATPCHRGGGISSVPIGRPVANTQVFVLDRDARPVPIGVAGELHLGGVQLARVYLNRPELTAEKFVPNPLGDRPGTRLYRTGDLTRYLPDGNVDFLGRLDFQVKIRGNRIELGEIESALTQHPAVREAVVLARQDQPDAKRLVAYLIRVADAPLTVSELRTYLKARLPDYMVPAAFVMLDVFPLTSSGKVDRRALPMPDQARPELEEAFTAPRTSIEQRLADIWCQVLGLERVGVLDNFFELGGDSILSIQIVSRANQQGLRLSARQLFEHQTIAQLAAVADTAPAVKADQSLAFGRAPVTAIQQWFFDQQFADAHHFNQAVLLETREALDPATLQRAVDALLEQHDALRLRFVKEEGAWRQEATTSSSTTVISRIDLSALEEVEQRAALEADLARIQASLSLDTGPQIRVALFDLGRRGHRVLVAAHHLVVDGVSWRILLEDLQTAYDQATRDNAIQLPHKTTPYAVWAQRCRAYAASAEVQNELPYWLAVSDSTASRLPVDDPRGSNTVDSARTVTVALDAEDTEALLRQVPDVYRTHINDVLLTAVTDAFAMWTGERFLLIDMEGHGREELFADVDVSRTVGWFTAMYPVLLEWESGHDPGASLKSIKEQLRKIPNRGIGYGLLRYLGGDTEGRLAALPKAEITFNYLGQIDQALPESSRFGWAAESPGPTQSPRAARSHLLDVNGMISDGRLRLSLKFSENRHRPETIQRLADNILGSLRSLIRHCQTAEAGGSTPSDFPLSELDQQELDRLIGRDRTIEDVYPLSPMQQGLLFHTLLDSASGVYVEQFCCTVRGEIDQSRFQAAWQRAVDRHPALRTSFRHMGLRQPLQIVHRQVRIEFAYWDWRELSQEAREREFDAFLQRDRERGFDLSNPPLMRLALLRIAGDACQVVWTYHHLLLDGWSVPIVLNDVLADYESASDGERLRQVPSRPYRDFIAWHRDQDLEAAERFWRRALEGFTAPTPLTVDVPNETRAGEVTPHEEEGIELSKSSTDALRSLGRLHQLTLNTFVQAAWGLLLNRYSGQDDVLFGATVSGRQASVPGVESIVGLFINTVPVRVRVRGGESLIEWLHVLQREQLDTRDYEYCPLGKVQAWSELPAGTPLFESLLVFENYPVDQALVRRQQGLRVDRARTIERTNYPLTLVVAPGEQLSLRINYDATRFDPPTVSRMLGHLEALLEEIIRNADRRVDDIPMLTRAERQQLVVAWNDTHVPYAGPRCVHQMFEDQVAKTPDSVALIFEGRALTYSALDSWANTLAGRLVTLGVRPNVLVGLFMDRGPEMVAGILGVLKAGGAYVPLPRAYPQQRLQFMLDDCGARLVLTQTRLAGEVPSGSVTVECVDDPGAANVGRLLNPPSGVTANDLAYVIYTSGSTGRPKGTMIEHRSVVNYLEWSSRAYRLAEGRGAPVQSSLGFDATITSLILPLLTGRCVVLLPEAQEVDALGAALASNSDFSLVKLTPAHLRMLVSMVPKDKAPGGTRAFIVGGEALTGSDIEHWRTNAPQTRLINEYGPTETVVGCCVYEVSEKTPRSGGVPIGRPIANSQLYVLDRRVDPTPVGVPGELYIGGAGLGRGYLNRPDLTAEKFVPDPFSETPGQRLYKTGDLGHHRLDGDLEYLGRRDDQVKLRGFRIELGEIEAVLSRHPNVREAVVLARDESRGKRLVAYVTSDGQTRPTVLELRTHLQAELPNYMVPAAFVMMDSLPLTANGKVDRQALPAPDGTRQELRAPFVAAGTDTEEKIAAIWKEAVGINTIGVDDNFFEVGGDSLIMIEVQWKLQEVFGRNVPLAEIFQNPTVRTLAAAFDRPALDEEGTAGSTSQSRAQTRLAAVKQRERRRDTRRGGQ